MIRLTLKQCEYFCAVARCGGIAAAARALGVSQPAVAQAMDKLEDMTGLVLLRRLHARGTELTAQGEAFLSYATELVVCGTGIEAAVEKIADNRSGTVRLGCFQSIAPFCLARIVRGYRALAPDVVLDVSEMLQEELSEALTQGTLDLAIMYDLGLDPGRISWRALTQAPPYLIVPPGHRLAERQSVSVRDIATEDYILFDAPRSRDYFFSIFARYGIGPRIAFRSRSIESVRCSVANGLGVSILSMRPASDATYDGGQVVPIALEEELPPTPVVLAHSAERPPGALAVGLADYVEDVFRGL
ncbi:LysR family transcriptional regulator [Candidatus Halocynthiibacter alkanivorans]|uniref:LysR family transcriptional regulator n=1 Tax=Candidatus Halocynthiibacter alkanivorans TaxID=2267619 RepID=UPI000DF1EF1A|nr:LysR family transcriptional regulator [Candidatus Halocynthiibacter alkanivorans]